MNMHYFTPARIALAAAVAAVAGNLYLLAGDALAPEASASARSTTPSSFQAARGHLPGEPKANAEAQRRRSQ